MAELKINLDRCVGCGLCVSSCPAGALSMADKKARVDPDTCVLCGLCLGSCRFGAISIEKDHGGAADRDSYRDIWVFCEQRSGAVLDVGLELIAKARELAERRGCRVAALLLGRQVAHAAHSLIAAGADTVYLCEDAQLGHNLELPYAEVITRLIRSHRPEILLFGATAFGRSLAPRVAARVQTGLTADCTELDIDPDTGLLLQTRPAFGGNLMATIHTQIFRPQMATVRPGVLPAPTPDLTRTGEIVPVAPPEGLFDAVVLLEEVLTPPAASIADAEIIVAAGRGIDGHKNMALVEELAELLGGAVGCSRAVVDIGWAEYRHQIGQTGLAVSPKLLIACGISGSIQFLAGIGGAQKVVAINTDPEAPIFGVADYKIVGDCVEVLSALIARIKADRGL
jgi:electron transfer flavoprotein alpha subunit